MTENFVYKRLVSNIEQLNYSKMKYLLLVSALAVAATYADEARISKGQDVELGQLPYQALLQLRNDKGKIFRCGGSIISPNWIVTAAHCTHG